MRSSTIFVIESCDDYFHTIRDQLPWRKAISDGGLISKTGATWFLCSDFRAPDPPTPATAPHREFPLFPTFPRSTPLLDY